MTLWCSDFTASKVACRNLPANAEGVVLKFEAEASQVDVLALVVTELKRKGFIETPNRPLEFNHSLHKAVRLEKRGEAVWLVSP